MFDIMSFVCKRYVAAKKRFNLSAVLKKIVFFITVAFSTLIYAEVKLYPQLTSPTAQNIAGNWQVTLVNKEDKQLHRYFITMEAPYTSYCERISEHVCRYRVTDNAKGEWESAYVAAGNTFHRSFKINSSTSLDYEHAYGVVGDWGANSKITFSGNKGIGKWRYRDEDGVESWGRLLPTIDKVLFYPAARSEFKGQRHSGISQNGSIGEVTGVYDKWWWGPKNNAPGNRPVFYFDIYGKNLWGFHVIDMKESIGFGVPQCDRYLYKDHSEKLKDVVGLRCWAHIWPGVSNGTKTIRFDNHEIPFDLNITGLSEPLKLAVDIPQEWRYRDAMGEEDDYPKLDLNDADYAWKLKTNKINDWPTLRLSITGDGVSELDVKNLKFANKGLKLLSSEVFDDSIDLVVTLFPQTKQGDTSLTINDQTLPFTFEYGGGFPDLAISNVTVDPNSPHAFLNLTRPLDYQANDSTELLVSIKNEGFSGVDGFEVALEGDINDYWVYPKEINTCAEKFDGCKPCTRIQGEGLRYFCDQMPLKAGEAVLAKIEIDKNRSESSSEEKQQCDAKDEIELSVTGRKENTIISAVETLYSNNTTKATLERDSFDVKNVEFEGVTVIPDANGSVIYKYHDSTFKSPNRYYEGLLSVSKRQLFSIGETYPIDKVHRGGLFRIKVNLHSSTCDSTEAYATLKEINLSGESSYSKYPLTISADGKSLVDELPFIAWKVGVEYQLIFKQHQATITVEPLPSGVFSIQAKNENGHNYRVAKQREEYIVKMNTVDEVIPPNVWAMSLKTVHQHDLHRGNPGYSDFMLLEKINENTFIRSGRLMTDFYGDITVESSKAFKPADTGLDLLKVVREDTDLYGLDGLIFSEKGTLSPIDNASIDKQVVLQAKFNRSTPVNTYLTLTLIRGGSEIFQWKLPASRRESDKRLVSETINLAGLMGEYSLEKGDVIHARWQDNKDHVAVLNIQGQTGKLQSLSIKQNGSEVTKLELGNGFKVELDFEQIPEAPPSVYYQIEAMSLTEESSGKQKSKQLKLIDEEKALYEAEFIVNEYGRYGNVDEAFSGDKLKVSYHDNVKIAEFDSQYDENNILFAYYDGDGFLAEVKGTLVANDPKKSIRFKTNRYTQVPSGSYTLNIVIDGCCRYQADLEVDSATPEIVEIPQLAKVSLSNNPANSLVGFDSGKIGGANTKGWELLKQNLWPDKEELLLPEGAYNFVFKLPAPSNAVKGSTVTQVNAGENTIEVPAVIEMGINVFNSSGSTHKAKVTHQDQGRWETGEQVTVFKEKGISEYLLVSDTVLLPNSFSSEQAKSINIFLGEMIFYATRINVHTKRVCQKGSSAGATSVNKINWSTGPACKSVEYKKIYQLFPGEYYFEELSDLPRSYHTSEELSLIDRGAAKLKQRSTVTHFSVIGKQKAKLKVKPAGKAPSTVGG